MRRGNNNGLNTLLIFVYDCIKFCVSLTIL